MFVLRATKWLDNITKPVVVGPPSVTQVPTGISFVALNPWLDCLWNTTTEALLWWGDLFTLNHFRGGRVWTSLAWTHLWAFLVSWYSWSHLFWFWFVPNISKYRACFRLKSRRLRNFTATWVCSCARLAIYFIDCLSSTKWRAAAVGDFTAGYPSGGGSPSGPDDTAGFLQLVLGLMMLVEKWWEQDATHFGWNA